MHNEIKLEWEGETLSIPSKKTMEVLALVEQQVPLTMLIDPLSIPTGKIAAAYSAVLRFAGEDVDTLTVYQKYIKHEVMEKFFSLCEQISPDMPEVDLEKKSEEPQGK